MVRCREASAASSESSPATAAPAMTSAERLAAGWDAAHDSFYAVARDGRAAEIAWCQDHPEGIAEVGGVVHFRGIDRPRGLHIYTFNNTEDLERWRQQRLEAA